MPPVLLPRSAAAYAPRSKPTVVLPTRTEPWVKETLKRVSRGTKHKPLNSAPQQQDRLETLLAGDNAIWSLAAFVIPKTPEAEMTRKENPLVEAVWNCQMVHVEAYVVHIDMVAQHEVAFKLTSETITTLIKYYKDVYLVDEVAKTCPWPEKDTQVQQLQEAFVQAINSYVFRTGSKALEGMEEEGAGELLEGQSERAKAGIVALFKPLSPPPPPQQRMAEMVGTSQYLTVPSHEGMQQQWMPPPSSTIQQPMMRNEPWQQQQHHHHVLGSSPSPMSPESNVWSPVGQHETHMPSPASSYGQPFTPSQYCSPPASNITTLPSSAAAMLAPHCGVPVVPEYAQAGWTYSNDMMPQYLIQI